MTSAGKWTERATGHVLAAGAVTALFVPGDRPERFAKAAAAGAGVVIIDLEDAVAPTNKAAALAAVVDSLRGGDVRALVRVNPADSATHDAEISVLLGLTAGEGHGLLGIVLPKADDPQLLAELRARFPGDLALVPLVESAAGLMHAFGLACVPGVTRLAFGAIDFALDVDGSGEDRFLDHARSHLVVASRAAGIAAPLDSPCVDIQDEGKIAESALLARKFGFGGKLCIHPRQVPTVVAAFVPSEAEVAWAHSVIGAEGAAVQVDGQMIDRPVTDRAKRILAQAGKEL
ncbi:HpcH/HpaI aldolase/citrate lyase family protein [Paenarthrobacter sp. NPDC092416]|uniref:HpcH/HpaI aldolase/citrate lyase family protein n=1 Tax=Paenarthrobacter sp. NPDC092416 TaxID=3364386 RepID=UPI00380EDEB4